jgi:hypothetical protein
MDSDLEKLCSLSSFAHPLKTLPFLPYLRADASTTSFFEEGNSDHS